ncbi:uncharacterized protein LOC114188929 [Vigna unguiculata]|uniref:uncharacterized protein LOC114188929 n=1 Tax=Vigna unguiculata TaxID=3917 RepID=UPI001016A157|nr:uncharacterized protein LOC114188929 [Vigna unguiculata]
MKWRHSVQMMGGGHVLGTVNGDPVKLKVHVSNMAFVQAGKLRNEVGARSFIFYRSFLEFMGFTGKLRNEVGAECANGGWWAGFRNRSVKKMSIGSRSNEKMALGGTAPPRGSAAATANMRRRRTAGGGASGGAAGTMLQFYTDDAPGLKISPNVVLVMSIGFIAFVAILHVMG